MEIGERWAYREPPHTPGKAALPVKVLKFGPKWSRQAHVRWLAGDYAGLAQWVTRDRLIARWDEIDAFLNDEVCYAASRAASPLLVDDTTEADAAALAFYCYPRPDGIMLANGVAEIPDLDATRQDLGLDRAFFFTDPLAYVDREGAYVGPWPITLALAQRVAAVYPALVLEETRKREREWEQAAIAGREIDNGRNHSPGYMSPEACAAILHERQPAFALVRAWCGEVETARFDEAKALRAEAERLRRLVDEAGRWLTDAGHPRVAARLRKEAGIPPPRRFEVR